MHVHQVWCKLVEHNSFVSFQSEDPLITVQSQFQLRRIRRGRSYDQDVTGDWALDKPGTRRYIRDRGY